MKPTDYDNLFRWDGKITCLHSELFAKGSHGLGDPLIIFDGQSWHTFLHKEKKELCLQKGLELFGDQQAYTKYSEDFRELITELYNIKIGELTRDILEEHIGTLAKLWEYYGLTEHFYTELAHERSNQNVIIAQNLADLNKLKIEGRKALNYVVFEDGLLHKILTQLSKRFLLEENDAVALYSEELLRLFDGMVPEKKTIERRKKYYAIAKKDDEIIRFSSDSANVFVQSFTQVSATSIKGAVANKGKARGRVVIAPMLTDKAEVQKIIDKMQQGDVLVAQSTTPELMVLIGKAAAIVTDQGGMLSHAAVVSREFNIPCIVGTNDATRILKDGDLVEVDAINGVVHKL